jgi:PAS domain S-box-containing protein
VEWDERLDTWYEVPEEVRRSGLLKELWRTRLHPDDRERAESVLAAALRDRTSYEDVFRILLPSGRVRYIQSLAVIERDADGKPLRLIGANRDITAQREQEEDLRASEERFHHAFEDANAGMCLVDLQGHFIKVNAKMSDIFGYSRQELEGMTIADLTLAEDRALSSDMIARAIQGAGDRATFEKRYVHRQGHVVYGQVSASLVRDDQGQPGYFISHVQDITPRKEAETALAKSVAELETANRELDRLATTDMLTGIWNRRYFEQAVATAIARVAR